jgi:hypothetical protein
VHSCIEQVSDPRSEEILLQAKVCFHLAIGRLPVDPLGTNWDEFYALVIATDLNRAIRARIAVYRPYNVIKMKRRIGVEAVQIGLGGLAGQLVEMEYRLLEQSNRASA